MKHDKELLHLCKHKLATVCVQTAWRKSVRGWTANVSVSRVTALVDGGLEANCRTKAFRDSNET